VEASAVLERVLVLAFFFIVFGVPAWITWLKGHREAFILGFILLGMVWWIAACRLAHPSSWWARQFYGPTKMRRALNRFGSETAATS
jgi:Kef-type K+ transport system membrane component KefB